MEAWGTGSVPTQKIYYYDISVLYVISQLFKDRWQSVKANIVRDTWDIEIWKPTMS